jgi:ligand-binding sensor domain-containing protein
MVGGDTIKIIQFYHSSTNPQTLADNYVRTIFQDKEGDIWVGTYNGPGYLQKDGCRPEKKQLALHFGERLLLNRPNN